MKKFFEELSRRLREGGVESSNVEDRRLEIFLHGQPVLFVSPGNDVFLFPAGSNNPEASELYHRVAQAADEVYTYYCAGGRIPGAVKMAGVWLIPKNAEKPTDRRRKEFQHE